MNTMIDLNQLPLTRRGAKPKLGVIFLQKLAYMCTNMHCINRVKGVGCIQCVNACVDAVKQDVMTALTSI